MEELVSPRYLAGGDEQLQEEKYQIAIGESEDSKRQTIVLDSVRRLELSAAHPLNANLPRCYSAFSSIPLPRPLSSISPSCTTPLPPHLRSSGSATPPAARAPERGVSRMLGASSWSVGMVRWEERLPSRSTGGHRRSRECLLAVPDEPSAELISFAPLLSSSLPFNLLAHHLQCSLP